MHYYCVYTFKLEKVSFTGNNHLQYNPNYSVTFAICWGGAKESKWGVSCAGTF